MQHGQLLAEKYLMECVLVDPRFIEDALRFATFTAHWLLHIAACSPNGAAAASRKLADPIELPLPEEPSAEWRRVPEHLLSDILDLMLFLSDESVGAQSMFDSLPLNALMQLIVSLLHSPQYIRSPHLRAKFGEVLFQCFLPIDFKREQQAYMGPVRVRNTSAQCAQLLETNADAVALLAPCLMRLYGDVEHTGFYEKNSHRFKIALILKFLWQSAQHRRAFHKISRQKAAFISFTNGVLNNTNQFITEALTALPQIRDLQEAMADDAAWGALSEQEREEKEHELDEKERMVKTQLLLANETISMMVYLSSEIVKPFVIPASAPPRTHGHHARHAHATPAVRFERV